MLVLYKFFEIFFSLLEKGAEIIYKTLDCFVDVHTLFYEQCFGTLPDGAGNIAWTLGFIAYLMLVLMLYYFCLFAIVDMVKHNVLFALCLSLFYWTKFWVIFAIAIIAIYATGENSKISRKLMKVERKVLRNIKRTNRYLAFKSRAVA